MAAALPVAQVPLLYADAIGNVLLSPINTRLTFVVNVGPAADGKQPVNAALELVIPTAALLQFSAQFQEHVKTQGPGLLNAFEQVVKQLSLHMGKKP